MGTAGEAEPQRARASSAAGLGAACLGPGTGNQPLPGSRPSAGQEGRGHLGAWAAEGTPLGPTGPLTQRGSLEEPPPLCVASRQEAGLAPSVPQLTCRPAPCTPRPRSPPAPLSICPRVTWLQRARLGTECFSGRHPRPSAPRQAFWALSHGPGSSPAPPLRPGVPSASVPSPVKWQGPGHREAHRRMQGRGWQCWHGTAGAQLRRSL